MEETKMQNRVQLATGDLLQLDLAEVQRRADEMRQMDKSKVNPERDGRELSRRATQAFRDSLAASN